MKLFLGIIGGLIAFAVALVAYFLFSYGGLGEKPSVMSGEERLAFARSQIPRRLPIYVLDNADNVESAGYLSGRAVVSDTSAWQQMQVMQYRREVGDTEFEIVTLYTRHPPVFDGYGNR
jgi:hypothetical protein